MEILQTLRSPSWVGTGPALVGTAALLAYRPLWLGSMSFDVDTWLFQPGTLPRILVLAVAIWLLWTRIGRLRSSPVGSVPLLAISLATIGASLFIWALLTRKADLLFASLAANGLAFAAAARGGSGLRVSLLPALTLLLGIRIPKPLEDEIVWHLQVWTARGAGELLENMGREFVQSGVILSNTKHTFHVIDSCSGLNGIAILMLVALVVRELFWEAGAKAWLVVLLAPPLGMALNVIRVAYVAASPNPEDLAGVEGDHAAQGLALVMVGSGILYLLGWALARGNARLAGPRVVVVGKAPWTLAAGWLVALAVLSWTVPRFSDLDPQPRSRRIEMPETRGDWVSEPAPHELLFTGIFSREPRGVHRRYQIDARTPGSPDVVDLLIGYDSGDEEIMTRLLSSKLLLPGPEWNLVDKRDEQLWLLAQQAELVIAARDPGGEHAVLYAWRPRDAGLWIESWRALFGIDRSPLRRHEPRAAVRLVTYAPHDGQLALDQARQRLDRFVKAFREELSAL